MKYLYMIKLVWLFFLISAQVSATSIDDLMLEQHVTQCQEGISQLAVDVIKTNPHRFHRPQTKQQAFSAIAIVEYRDRNSHLTINASIGNKGQCEYNVTESFVVPHPCVIAREEVFKKWSYIGKMNDKSMVLKSKKQPEKLAYLSNAVDGSICMISTKFSVSD